MGLLRLFDRPAPVLLPLPSGSFTSDRHGMVLIDTLPSTFPRALLGDIAQQVLRVFREAAEAQLPLAELNIQYASLRITARELRGGALVFLAPQGLAPARWPIPGGPAGTENLRA
jgi:hypothetical protein